MIDAGRWAWAEIDLEALDRNIARLRRLVAPAQLWAVVKADAYGHGAVDVAARAVESGAAGVCVALVEEGVELRRAGIDAPILVLSQQPPDQLVQLIEHRLTPTAYTVEYLDAIAEAVGSGGSCPVHLKLDTGMQRVGADPADAVRLAGRVAELAPRLELAGVFTHLACADQPEHRANSQQLASFDEALAALAAHGRRPPLVHAANSAAAVALPASRFDAVRAGIAIYGISPGAGVDHLVSDLEPVLSLRARVAFVKRVGAGSHVSYGWRHRFERDTTVATLPLGYADGVPRRLGTLPDADGTEVLIGGRRHPIVGVVTMDQLMVDVGDDAVAVGDEAVLIGTQGDQRIKAEDWATRLGTIGYEIVCGIGARIPRRIVGR
jgi:alanine racemase